jgi:proline iminopeptidase
LEILRLNLFLHGGPGGSALDFEITTAEKLAEKGFYVILYDRRGEGRSTDEQALFTYKQTINDLKSLYEQFGIKKASLLGHSFGGIVATLFAEQHPAMVENIILAGTPVSLQQTFRTILAKSEQLYKAKDSVKALAQLDAIKKYDTSSIYYSSGCFMLAMQNRFYNTSNPGDSASELYKTMQSDQRLKDYMDFISKTGYKTVATPTMKFLKNENYTSIDISGKLSAIRKNGIPVFGIYGKEDGLFDEHHISSIKSLVTKENHFVYLDNCSHGVFMDQQEKFIQLLNLWLN